MITDELRKYASGFAGMLGVTTAATTTDVKDDLEEIADRIDEKHEECAGFCRRLEDAAKGGEEVTIFGTDYVPLPKDADGEPIHLQDRVSWDNGTFNVHELKLDADGWTTWDELHGYTVHADQCHHVKPDSWERIISDALRADRTDAYAVSTSMLCELVERCKRLAGEGA